MNIHAIGWGILAMFVTILCLDIFFDSRPKTKLFWGILIGLAVTLIIW